LQQSKTTKSAQKFFLELNNNHYGEQTYDQIELQSFRNRLRCIGCPDRRW